MDYLPFDDEPPEPPIARRKDPWTSRVAAVRIQPTRGSKREKILLLLQRDRGQWLSGPMFTASDVGGSEGLRRLRELRQMGWRIERRPMAGSRTTWQYRLAADQ